MIRTRLLFTALSLLVALSACGGGGVERAQAPITVDVAGLSKIVVDENDPRSEPARVRITVDGPGLSPRSVEFDLPRTTGRVEFTLRVPFGPVRRIGVEVLNAFGEALYAGFDEITLDLNARLFQANIRLAPVLGPTGIAAYYDEDSVSLSWTPVRGIATYNVYGGTTPDVAVDEAFFLAKVEGNSYSHTGLTAGEPYYYLVTAVNVVRESEPSLQVRAVPGAPRFDGLVSAVATSSSTIELEWFAAEDDVTPEPEIIYYVYLASVSGGQDFSTPSLITLPGMDGFTISGLNPGQTYYIVVRAKDGDGITDGNGVEKAVTMPLE